MRVYIARHGQNVDNAVGILNGHRDLPLTDLGRSQASELARGIKEAKLVIHATYSSPLVRAYETAQIITDELLHDDPVVEPLLIERNFGIMTGRQISEIPKICGDDVIKTDTITYFLSPKGAETFPRLLDRAHALLAKLRTRHEGDTVLLVTHGDIGKMIYAAFYKLNWLDVLKDFHFGNSELLELSDDSPATAPHVIRITQHNH